MHHTVQVASSTSLCQSGRSLGCVEAIATGQNGGLGIVDKTCLRQGSEAVTAGGLLSPWPSRFFGLESLGAR